MFGQIVIGPPGSGKSTYCHGMLQFMSSIGRLCSVINLDPANDRLNYDCAFDIRDFVTLEEVMDDFSLGPNGGLMFALESFTMDAEPVRKSGLDLIVEKIVQVSNHGKNYLIFDCPGQVELFTHSQVFPKLFRRLTSKQHDLRLCVVSLIDSFYLTSPSQYISVLLLALRSMLQLDLPHINVFSKIDLLKNYGALPFNLDFYTEVQDLHYLIPHIEKENRIHSKYNKLTDAIAELVEEFNLVSFEVLAVEDKQSMIRLLSVIDKANGYLFGATEIGGDTVWVEATRQSGPSDMVIDIQERWIDNKDRYDQKARKEQEDRLEEQQFLDRELGEDEELELAMKEWDERNSK
ncbi:hypothetical protein BABINDRAFT_56308 [Babjeviella inositovora NRRL Y-12698]|uniref:GPN-loop GTPase 2 n=1 Tax=Babjeviella inositovora NRRL Y-12698 TaxID=984486 RepID=A0A1E3QY33_9ASCO|nr:uncharacterized protein BABINDRAFT_56308 [Babjeviella inositovora NRRL Y-12698]ODQ82563.1 hypothetical protein BABINDRAFT_56308 [Babjeviella inositovora NRRL Y-12698]